jgi:hypothetical protein
MARNVFAKNVTASGVQIPDLSGIYIEPYSERDLREYFSLDDIDYSLDLREAIEAGLIVLNDGEKDLTTEESLDISSVPTFYELTDTFVKLKDTPTTYSGAARFPTIVNAAETGLEFGLIPETAISGTYFVSYEGGRLLRGATGNRPDLVYIGPVAGLAFDHAKTESCYGSFKIPYSWHDNTNIELKINFMNDDAQTGVKTCAWHLAFHAYAAGETYGSKTLTTLHLDTALPNNAIAGTFLTETLVVPYNDVDNPLSTGDTVTFQFYRDGLSVNDDMFGDSILIYLSFELQTGDLSQLAG